MNKCVAIDVLLQPILIARKISNSLAVNPESVPAFNMGLLLNEVGLDSAKSIAASRSDRGAFLTMNAFAPAFFAART